jgi:hypothetical protein
MGDKPVGNIAKIIRLTKKSSNNRKFDNVCFSGRCFLGLIDVNESSGQGAALNVALKIWECESIGEDPRTCLELLDGDKW